MSILPAVRVIFDPATGAAEMAATANKIRALQGVLSASFNADRRTAIVTYTGDYKVQESIRALDSRLKLEKMF